MRHFIHLQALVAMPKPEFEWNAGRRYTGSGFADSQYTECKAVSYSLTGINSQEKKPLAPLSSGTMAVHIR